MVADRPVIPGRARLRASPARRGLLGHGRPGSLGGLPRHGRLGSPALLRHGQPGSSTEGDVVGRFEGHKHPLGFKDSQGETIPNGTHSVHKGDESNERQCKADDDKAEHSDQKHECMLEKLPPMLEETPVKTVLAWNAEPADQANMVI